MDEEVVSRIDARRVGEITALLGSMGIDSRTRNESNDRVTVLVDGRDFRRADALLREEFPEGIVDLPPPPRPVQQASEVAGRGLAGLVVILLACAAVFQSLHGGPSPARPTDFLAHGAIRPELVDRGEYWRWASAIFVHFDGVHIATNMLTLAFLGPLLAHIVGARRFVLIFVLAGIGGNALSHYFGNWAALKAGASGGVAGVLGALAGLSLAPRASPAQGGRQAPRRWQVFGGVIAAYALLVGTSPRSDDLAHAGGLLSGILLGRLSAPAKQLRYVPRFEEKNRGS